MARVLNKAGVGKQSAIWVTGPAGLTAMIWLNREGYSLASYTHANRFATMWPADALLIPHACSASEMLALLEDATCLKLGGALIVQLGGNFAANAPEGVEALFERLGFRVERQVIERGLTVCIARRTGHPGLQIAA